MDTLLGSFVAVLLAEVGDRSQLLAILLVLRFPGREAAVLAAAGVAAAISTGIGAAGGAIVHDVLAFRALSLMVALSLVAAGVGSLAPLRSPSLKITTRLDAFAASLIALLAAGLGDKTQFMAFTLAARADAPVVATVGATLGVVAAAAPAVMLGRRLASEVPLRALRRAIGGILLIVGIGFALDALRLI